jgi:uncharacterized protein (DUF1501 family)
MKRSEFVKISTLASTAIWMPKFLNAFNGIGQTAVPQGNKVVVILQFNGGNDGLNTVIPISNDLYYKNRPKVAIEKAKALKLTDDVALHPELTCLQALHNNGHLAILNNVGYPNPDRSHFRSMDIWHTASQSNEYLSNGWLGRYLDHQCVGCDKPTYALEFDDVLGLALKGKQQNGLAFKNINSFYNNANSKIFEAVNKNRVDEANEQPVDYLYKTLTSTVNSAKYILEQSKRKPSSGAYPATEIGNSFKTISSLIQSDINTKVYYVSIGSFDTHVGQNATQSRLFKQINDALLAFTNDLKAAGRFNDVLTFTFSEFGRRVAQNASGGTDHGTASNMFFISGGLKKQSILNELPNLQNLDNGDLKYTVDFKQVYATVLKKWLNTNDEKILNGKFETLDFI